MAAVSPVGQHTIQRKPAHACPCSPVPGLTVFVIVSVVGGENLPPQTTAARLGVPAVREVLEDAAREAEPLRPVPRRVREAALRGRHGGDAPEALVVVAHAGGPVGRHVVAAVAGLPQHPPHDEVVVGGVPGKVPVVDERRPHGRRRPPVVVAGAGGRRAGQDAGNLALFVALVVLEEVAGDSLGGGFDVG